MRDIIKSDKKICKKAGWIEQTGKFIRDTGCIRDPGMDDYEGFVRLASLDNVVKI